MVRRQAKSPKTNIIKRKLFETFRYKYGLGVLLHKFRKETGKVRFTYEDFISWYMKNWWRFHKRPLSTQTIGRALRLFAELNFVIERIYRKGRKVVFTFWRYRH